MKIWGLGQISNDEKNDILSKHRELYNGYQTMQPKVDNTQSLFVQDFANDKGGLVVNNKGEVKAYTNMGINEQTESKEVCDECGAMEMEEHWQDGDPQYTRLDEIEELCSECGGRLEEGECSECGWKGEVGAMEENVIVVKAICDNCGGLMEDGECPECGHRLEKLDERTGHLDDIYNVKDLNPHSEFDYVKGNDNYKGSFEQEHKMKKITNEDYDDFIDNFEDPDNENDATVGSTDLEIDSSEMYEQGFTGGGNAPDFGADVDDAYNFRTKGPEEGDGPYNKKANDMDLDDEDVWEPFDFESEGPGAGDSYPVFEQMKSAWDDSEEEEYELPDMETDKSKNDSWKHQDMEVNNDFVDYNMGKKGKGQLPNPEKYIDVDLEENDISGVQGIYGEMEPPYDFDSEGPGKAGPYQRSSWNEENDDESDVDFDVDSEEDEKPSEKDLKTFDPKDKSWSEINAFLGTDELEHLDEDLKESVIKQQTKIIEMFNRIKVIK